MYINRSQKHVLSCRFFLPWNVIQELKSRTLLHPQRSDKFSSYNPLPEITTNNWTILLINSCLLFTKALSYRRAKLIRLHNMQLNLLNVTKVTLRIEDSNHLFPLVIPLIVIRVNDVKVGVENRKEILFCIKQLK